MQVKIFTTLGFMKYYTNIKFTDKQLADPVKLFDLSISSKLCEEIEKAIPPEEYEFIIHNIEKSITSFYSYRTSLLGILDVLKLDYSDLNAQLSAILGQINDTNSLALINQLNSLKSDVFYDNLVEFKDLDVAGFKKYLGNDVSVVSANKPSCSELSYLSRLFKNLDITDIYSQISPPDFYIMWGPRFLDNNYRALRAAKLYKKPMYVFEDGFIKSIASPYDKNADIEYRCNMSYTVNSSVAYFDGIEVSALEKMINNPEIIISEEEKKRARECIDKIVSNHITKYNHQQIFNPEIGRKGAKKILVIDQTYGDMSIVKGCANDNTFKYMLECAINENPDADIIVKTHPDTMLASQIKGYYTGLTQHDNIYPYTEAVNPIALINYCDEVYVCTSQMGFEALMCGKKVHTFGVSFYSQYGLTEDYQKCERRTVKRTLEEMFYIIYIMFSYYVLPEKEGKCEIEDVIDYVIQKREEFFNGKAQEAECIMK